MKCVVMAIAMVVFMGLAPLVQAQPDESRQEQVDAATSRAVDELLADVARTKIDQNVTVREFLDKTGGEDELLSTLRRAEQIGGPRWIDEETCQVHLEITGARVARTLSQIAASKPKRSPIAPDVLEVRLADWRGRTFASTGTSTTSSKIERIIPPEDDNWTHVSEEARKQAIGDAKYNAAMKVIDSIAHVKLTDDLTVGDAMANEEVADHMHQWFAARPVTNLEFRQYLQLGITLSAKPEEVADVLREGLKKQKAVPVPSDDAEWARIKQQIIEVAEAPIGRGSVPADAVLATDSDPDAHPDAGEAPETKPVVAVMQRRNLVPRDNPPDWVNGRLTTDGSAPTGSSKLRSARAAENDALEKLEAEVRDLKLTDEITVGAAADEDPRIEEAVVRCIRSAKAIETNYDRPDGSVGVVLELDLDELWSALLNTP